MLNCKLFKMEWLGDWNIYFTFFIMLTILVFCYNPINSLAKVGGRCDGCHTMHNSQDGEVDPNGPFDALLLVTDCLGCHSASDGSTWKNMNFGGAPVVYNMSAPEYGAKYKDGPHQGLAGGNFYWVDTDADEDTTGTKGDNRGHNVFQDNPDDTLTKAPGEVKAPPVCFDTSCHQNLHEPFNGEGGASNLKDRRGCTGCHMVDDDKDAPKGFHHADDTNNLVGSENNDTDGYYRFLQGHAIADDHGVAGIEDPNWQVDPDLSHNEYLGGPDCSLNEKHTMSAFCCGCHGKFHEQIEEGLWIRHPSDAPIPSSGEYSSYTIYNPEAPVARSVITGVENTVTLDDDMVMCLSCHRPHGSPYPDMLRWDYDDMKAGGGNGSVGCFICHSEKSTVP